MTNEDFNQPEEAVNQAAEPTPKPKENRYQRIMRRQQEERARREALRKAKHAQREAERELRKTESMFVDHVSTGPKTPEGKAIASRNALKHGGCSTATLIVEGESMDDFTALTNSWFQGYGINPEKIKNKYEADLIRQAAKADWLYQRSDRNYAEAYARLPVNILDWTEDHHKLIARFQRYRTANANILTKHRKAIEDYRKARTKELQQTQAMQHKSERLAMARQKHNKKMDDDAPIDWPVTLAEMKQTAINLGFKQPDEEENS